jgi:hypothetical protein
MRIDCPTWLLGGILLLSVVLLSGCQGLVPKDTASLLFPRGQVPGLLDNRSADALGVELSGVIWGLPR